MTKRCLLLGLSCLLVLTGCAMGCAIGNSYATQGWVSKTGLYHFAYHKEENRIGALSLDERFQLAQKGDRYAQFNLGMLYVMGVEVDADTDKSKEWFLKSAQSGHLGALEFLSENYGYQLNAEDGLREALENAEQGNPSPFKVNSPNDRARIQALLALDYSKGNGQIDEALQIQIYDTAAQQGDVESIFKLATLHLKANKQDTREKALEGFAQFETTSKGKLPPYMRLAKARLENKIQPELEEEKGAKRYPLALEDLKKAIQSGEGASADWIVYSALLMDNRVPTEGKHTVKAYAALSIGVLKNVEMGIMEEVGAYFILTTARMGQEVLSTNELEEAKALAKQCMKKVTSDCY